MIIMEITQTVYTTQLDSTHIAPDCAGQYLHRRRTADQRTTPARMPKKRAGGVAMWGILGVFCRRQPGRFCIWRCISKAAASRGRFLRRPSVQPLQPCARAVRPGGMPATSWCGTTCGWWPMCKKYYAATSNQDDLISIGTIGLIKAVDTFDPARASKVCQLREPVHRERATNGTEKNSA